MSSTESGWPDWAQRVVRFAGAKPVMLLFGNVSDNYASRSVISTTGASATAT